MRNPFTPLCVAVLVAALAPADARADLWPPTAEDVKIMAEADREEWLNLLKMIEAEYKEEGEDGNQLINLVKKQSKTVAKQPKNPDARLIRGRTLLDSGAYNRAREDFAAVTKSHPGDAVAWYLGGLAQERLGKLDKAQEYYAKAIELDPEGAGGLSAKWDQQMLDQLTAPEQKVMVERLGPPDSFSIVVVGDPNDPELLHRQETWFYYRLGKAYDFLDGALGGESDLPGEPEAVADFLIPPYRPYQFVGGMDFATQSLAIGQDQFAVIELGSDPRAEGELVYGPMLAMGFKDGGLFYVRTIPFFMGKN